MSDLPVLVTGAAAGIGRAVAERLLTAGTPVIGVDLRADGPPGADLRACDLADPVAVAALLAALPAALGGVASVAGLPGTHPPARVLAVNLLAPRHLGAALAPRVARGGAIVHVASVAAGRCPLPDGEIEALLDRDDDGLHAWLAAAALDGSATYDLTKKALLALARRQARAGLADGVRALTVSPGPTETAILADFTASMGADRMAAATAVVGRHGTPDDVAPLITFLLGAEAGWINAVDIRVDGGLLGVR